MSRFAYKEKRKFDMKEYKILALLAPGDAMPEVLLKNENVSIAYPYLRGTSFTARVIRKFLLCIGLADLYFIFSLRNVDFKLFDVILVNENVYPLQIIKYIRKENKKCEIYYWLWNTLFTRSRRLYNAHKHWNDLLKEQKVYNYQIVSFDKKDCNRYNLIYNEQVAPIYDCFINTQELKKDVFFGGMDKGRLELLKKIGAIFNEKSISYEFWVLAENRRQYTREEWDLYLHNNFLSYNSFLQKELESKCILEIVQDKQNGITWRPLEALFYKKKLITNFTGIVNYDFYNPDNIFILGKDDLNKIAEFIKKPYISIDENIIQKYTFKKWIKRLLAKDKNLLY